MEAGDWVAVYAAIVATVVAFLQWRRGRPTVTVWSEVSGQGELIAHVVNTGHRPISVDFIGITGSRWPRRSEIVRLPVSSVEAENARLEVGRSTERMVPTGMLREQGTPGDWWIYVGNAIGAARYRRIPAPLIRHVTQGPPGARRHAANGRATEPL